VGDCFFFVNATVRRLYIHYLLNADDDQSTPNETSERRPRANRRCSETPLSETSDEVGRWVGLLTCPVGGPTRGSLARLSFVDLFP
jgi:hypothetical protein